MKRIKKILFLSALLGVVTVGLWPIEAGVMIGSNSKPNRVNYGVSGSMGFIIPILKFEVEYYRFKEDDLLLLPKNTLTAGVKFRPKFGRFSPFAVVGVGGDFNQISLKKDEFDTFVFIGGGLYIHLSGPFSLRGDVRFLNYSGFNRTRVAAGVFFRI